MSTSSLRRQVKNIVHNYSEAEIKVREATSNDPWGPSSSLMCEIADLTYNVVAFSEIMSMVWRRLNDHGKNWRHVYKALTLAEYLIKTGSERVAQQCRENIYAVQTLKDFQYVDRDGKDQGVNVREKAKQLVALLKDDEKLKEERTHALKTKEKLAQVSTVASAPTSASASAPASSSASLHSPPEIEQAWPQSTGEEELQLQLALAMSKEEADQRLPPAPGEDLQMRLAMSLSKEEHDKEERMRRGDDLRLQMAIEESQKPKAILAKQDKSSLMDLADVFTASAPVATNDPWVGGPLDPSSAPVPLALPVVDPWGAQAVAAAAGPWGVPQTDPPLPPGGEAWGATPGPLPTAMSNSWDVLGTQSTVMAAAPEPWASVPAPAAPIVTSVDPWAPVAQPLPAASASSSPPLPETFMDPWEASSPSPPAMDSTAKPNFDPFVAPVVNDDFSDFDALRSHVPKSDSGAGEPDLLAGEVPLSRSEGSKSPNLFDLAGVGGALPETLGSTQMAAARKTPESFLGPNAALVDLDALVSKSAKTSNPFLSAGGATVASATNPFGAGPPPTMTLNQLRASPVTSLGMACAHPSISPLGSVMPPAPALSPLVALPPGPGPLLPATLPAAMPPMVALATAQNGFGLQPVSNTNPFLL